MLIFMRHIGTWQQKFVTLTLPGSLSKAVALFNRNKIVEYRNGEKQFNSLIASRMGGLGDPRSQ